MVVDAEHPLAVTTASTTAPAQRVRHGDDIRLVVGGGDPAANRDQRLIDLVVEARVAYERLNNSTAASFDELAAECGHSRKHFSRLLRLATPAPDIVAAIVDGKQPAGRARQGLLSAGEVPVAWGAQRARLGFGRRGLVDFGPAALGGIQRLMAVYSESGQQPA